MLKNNLILGFFILRTLVYIYSPIEKLVNDNPIFFSSIRPDAYTELLLLSVFFFGLAFGRARKEISRIDIKIFNYILLIAPVLLILFGVYLSSGIELEDTYLQNWVFVDLFITFYSFVITILLFLDFANHLNSWNVSFLFLVAIYIFLISLFEKNKTLFEIMRTLPYILMSLYIASKRKISSSKEIRS